MAVWGVNAGTFASGSCHAEEQTPGYFVPTETLPGAEETAGPDDGR